MSTTLMNTQIKLRPHQQRATDAMLKYNKGIICAVTGAGKTLVGVADTMREFASETPKTVIVVSPRILLAEQLSHEYLEFITNTKVFHCHSGETHWESSTRPYEIKNWYENNKSSHKLIFTTYHSLSRLQVAGIEADAVHMDEAHNSIQKHFFPAVEYFSKTTKRFYSYTATPKNSNVIGKPGMNWSEIYGQIIVNVSGPEMVRGGYIVPPKVEVKQLPMVKGRQVIFDRDAENLMQTIDDYHVGKVLVCAKTTKQIIGLISETDFCKELEDRGYSWMVITSKTGAIIDGKKVDRELFFDTLNAWGKDNSKKFVVIHHSIISEGISVSGLEAVIFMRPMDVIQIAQSIGRIVRLHHDDAKGLRDGSIQPGALGQYTKSFALCVVPVYTSVGISTAKKVQAVVDTIFIKGEPCVSTVNR
jgi:superfamily II DNA or RNA helicase